MPAARPLGRNHEKPSSSRRSRREEALTSSGRWRLVTSSPTPHRGTRGPGLHQCAGFRPGGHPPADTPAPDRRSALRHHGRDQSVPPPAGRIRQRRTSHAYPVRCQMARCSAGGAADHSPGFEAGDGSASSDPAPEGRQTSAAPPGLDWLCGAPPPACKAGAIFGRPSGPPPFDAAFGKEPDRDRTNQGPSSHTERWTPPPRTTPVPRGSGMAALQSRSPSPGWADDASPG